jgi:uncharacterized protein
MQQMKQLSKYIILFFFAINLQAQETDAIKKDSPKSKSIELYRKAFWENLPKRINWTNDYENLFSNEEQVILDSIITDFEKETSIEIGIVTIDSLKSSKDNFYDLTLHLANSWGIGKKGKDNGILIAICKGYKTIRIQNGYGIEKIMTYEETQEIIFNQIVPAFREEKYFQGTLNGLKEIIKLLKSRIK